MKDAQQQIIDELRLEIASLTKGNETLHKIIDEWTPKGCIRLDDPVVTGLVKALNKFTDDAEPRYINFFHATKALSAYEARVKEVGK